MVTVLHPDKTVTMRDKIDILRIFIMLVYQICFKWHEFLLVLSVSLWQIDIQIVEYTVDCVTGSN